MKIFPIPAFSDNYIWAMHDESSCVVVDPGDAEVVLAFLQQHNLTLAAILITHHHHDHTGGIQVLSEHYPDIHVFGPSNAKIKGITQALEHNDVVYINELKIEFIVSEIPGHTLDHIMYYTKGLVFCGDTLFSAGCGRMFEGSPAQMRASLKKISDLPEETMIYCTHEYTQANVQFALHVEPNNQYLQRYESWVQRQRGNGIPTIPTSLSEQLQLNPFLRLHEPDIKAFAEQYANNKLTDSVQVFAALRKAKDEF